MRFHKTDKGRYSWYLGRGEWNWGDPVIRLEFSRKYNFGLGFKISRGDERDIQLGTAGLENVVVLPVQPEGDNVA